MIGPDEEMPPPAAAGAPSAVMALRALARAQARAIADGLELAAWRAVGPGAQRAVERMLAAQGDQAEPELVRLQHDLARLVHLGTERRVPNSEVSTQP